MVLFVIINIIIIVFSICIIIIELQSNCQKVWQWNTIQQTKNWK